MNNSPPEPRFPLDAVVNHRWYYNQRIYKVEWADGSHTWEKEGRLREDGCGKLIDAYERAEKQKDNDWVPDCFEEQKALKEEYRYKRRLSGTEKRRRKFRRKLSKEVEALKAAEADWCFFPHSRSLTPEDEDWGQREETSSEDSNIIDPLYPILSNLMTFSWQSDL